MADQHELLLAKYKTILSSNGYLNFLIKHGREWPVGPRTFSGRKGIMNRCYRNSAVKVYRDPSSFAYCEGICVLHSVPIPHAWCVDQRGEVVETTMRPSAETRPHYSYFGVAFNTKYLQRCIKTNKRASLFEPEDGWRTVLPLLNGETPVSEFKFLELYGEPNEC